MEWIGLIVGAVFGGAVVFYRMKTQALQQSSEINLQLQNSLQKIHFLEEQAEKNRQEQILSAKEEEEKTQKWTQQFELLAHRIFDEKSTRFQDLSQKNLTSLLDPLRDRLKDFEKKVEDTYSQERFERGVLKGELHRLLELNQVMSQETQNLTRALKSDVKTQGHWGELILENILERSGLRKNEEYTLQGESLQLRNDSGARQQPDVIVHLPGGKHIIIDSKMSLKAFEGFTSCTLEEERKKWSQLHVKSLEDHVVGLSGKKYHHLQQLISPDFVILFMPLEPAFALAFQAKAEIFTDAWEKSIAIVSPTTLLTTLRTVAALWKQERQQKNALEIARRGGLLYEKFVGLVKDFNDLGKCLDQAQQSHVELRKKLGEGRGNLLSQVEELKELGAKTEKSLPSLAGSLEGPAN